jgi:hypothetical protein
MPIPFRFSLISFHFASSLQIEKDRLDGESLNPYVLCRPQTAESHFGDHNPQGYHVARVCRLTQFAMMSILIKSDSDFHVKPDAPIAFKSLN